MTIFIIDRVLSISKSNHITIIMLSAEWMVMLLFLVESVPMVRLECTDGALLRAQCSSSPSIRSFLMHESPPGSVRIRCGHSATSYSWSKSDDGSAANAVILDTSSDKYTVVDGNSLDISLDNITKVDGGLYRCVYGGLGTSPQLCVYVFERAVFASCPQEYSGCSKEVPLSVTLGKPAIFDASITYTPGGSCNFKQAITRVKLTKINGQSNLPNTLLFTCRTDQGASCLINDNRLSLSRGDGLDYIFTLSNANQEDAGIYEVVMEGTHPATGSLITFKKSFHLSIKATTSPPVTPPAPVGVQALCSVVVWYSPEVSCEDMISGYEVQFYDPNFTHSNVTRYVGANRTFYGVIDEDRLAGENTHVQIRVLYNSIVGQWSDEISVGCNLEQITTFNLYFMLNGTVYLNNSDIPLLDVGEGDHALQCQTSRDECCRTLPNRFGDFYYPNGTQVFNERSGYGFYRNRGQKVIHLNRREGVTLPAGKYRCEIPDADGEMKSIFINLME